MAVTAWTEVGPMEVSYQDCTYCSILMVLKAAGKVSFPLGVNTHAERKAFRKGDPRNNFDGGVERAKERYGVTVKRLPDGSPAGLRAAVSTTGRSYAIAGKLANFPKGHPLRACA